jgi:Na+-translocating ferredoxin:NAD+ oxidoreductase RnfE subunit
VSTIREIVEEEIRVAVIVLVIHDEALDLAMVMVIMEDPCHGFEIDSPQMVADMTN